MKDLKLKLLPLDTTVNYKTANDIIQCLGRVKCRVTIGFKIMDVQLYVLKALLHPFLLGLDLIAAFSLEISPSLQIFQHLNENGIERREEILPSKTYQENFETNLNTLSTPITPLHFSQINQLIQQYSPIFALDKYNVGLISSSKCDIELNSHPDQFKTLPM